MGKKRENPPHTHLGTERFLNRHLNKQNGEKQASRLLDAELRMMSLSVTSASSLFITQLNAQTDNLEFLGKFK